MCNVVYDVTVGAGARRCFCAIIIRDDRHGGAVGNNDDERGRRWMLCSYSTNQATTMVVVERMTMGFLIPMLMLIRMTVHDHGLHRPTVTRWTGGAICWLMLPLLLDVGIFIIGSSRPSPSPSISLSGSVRDGTV